MSLLGWGFAVPGLSVAGLSAARRTTTSATPAAGIDHPVAHAVVDALTSPLPVAGPAEVKLWQVGDDEYPNVLLTVQHRGSASAGMKLVLLGAMEERQVTRHTTERAQQPG
jgi:hypothetical protein